MIDQGEKLAYLRKEKGLTLTALAELTGTKTEVPILSCPFRYASIA